MIDGVLVGLLSSFSTTNSTCLPLIPPAWLIRSTVIRTVLPAIVLYDAPGPVESSSKPMTMVSSGMTPADAHALAPRTTAAQTAIAFPSLTSNSRPNYAW